VELQENIPLAPYTTLGIGGPARYFAHIGGLLEGGSEQNNYIEAIQFARKNKLPIFVLGSGSNLLVSDEGFPGVVLHFTPRGEIHTPEVRHQQPGKISYEVDAGVDWDLFVRTTCEAGHTGIECLAGIPGLTGAAPVQNIGAYGQEVSQTIHRVAVVDLIDLGKSTMFLNKDCGFSYRRSVFNSILQGRYLVLAVCFNLSLNDKPKLAYADLAPLRNQKATPLDVYHAVRAIRDRKGMLIDPAHPHPDSRSAGSFFKNPIVHESALDRIATELSVPVAEIPNWPAAFEDVKLPAAWLIERAGFPKGFELGPVGISSRHTLALVNRTGTATCADLLRLRDLIVSTVAARFGIALEQEPVFLR
jgi:UDP-N-acetylmuramate dehydrogenase